MLFVKENDNRKQCIKYDVGYMQNMLLHGTHKKVMKLLAYNLP